MLDDATDERVAALAGVLPGLLPAAWSRRSDLPALTALGVRRIGIAEAVEAVRGVERPASWWAGLYAALDGADREELAALPVPLADGRTAHGPAGVLLPDPGLPVGRLGPLGLRLADPGALEPPAARRLLERLGARPATAAAVLADPAVRTAVETSMDAVEDALPGAPEPAELAEAVLALVGAARPAVGELPWLAELALPDDDGGWAPAGELVLPGSPLAAVLAAGLARDARPRLRGRGRRATRCAPSACSTRSPSCMPPTPTTWTSTARAEWADAVLDRLPHDAPTAGVAAAGRRPRPGTGRRLAAGAAPAGRRCRPRCGRTSSSAGFPRRAICAGGCRPTPCSTGRGRTASGTPRARSYRDCTNPRRPIRRCSSCSARRPRSTTCCVDVDGAIDLLDRLGDPARTVRPAVLRTVYARLAAALDGIDVRPPDRVRVAPDRVVADAVVLDAPYLQPLVDAPVVPAGGAPGRRRRPARPAAGR